jgi:hypothetical protein
VKQRAKTRRWQHRLIIACYRVIRWTQRRIPPGFRTALGLLLMVGGLLGFLPVLGFWMLPVGIAVVVTDVPPLRRRTERWINDTRKRYHMDLLNLPGGGRIGPDRQRP